MASNCRSSRTWVIGVGHVSLDAARHRHLNRIEGLEATMVERNSAVLVAAREVAEAQRRHAAAEQAAQETAGELLRAREHLTYLMSPLDDAERPERLRGAQHDASEELNRVIAR